MEAYPIMTLADDHHHHSVLQAVVWLFVRYLKKYKISSLTRQKIYNGKSHCGSGLGIITIVASGNAIEWTWLGGSDGSMLELIFTFIKILIYNFKTVLFFKFMLKSKANLAGLTLLLTSLRRRFVTKVVRFSSFLSRFFLTRSRFTTLNETVKKRWFESSILSHDKL